MMSKWSLDALAEYLISRIESVEKYNERLSDEREERNKERFREMKTSVDNALAATDKAIGKADTAIEKRFDAVNEFRQTLSDQATTFMPRAEYQVQHNALVDISAANSQAIAQIQAKLIGKSEGLSGIGALALGLFAGLSALAAVAMLIYTISRH